MPIKQDYIAMKQLRMVCVQLQHDPQGARLKSKIQKTMFIIIPYIQILKVYASICIEKFWNDAQVTIKSGSGDKENQKPFKNNINALLLKLKI